MDSVLSIRLILRPYPFLTNSSLFFSTYYEFGIKDLDVIRNRTTDTVAYKKRWGWIHDMVIILERCILKRVYNAPENFIMIVPVSSVSDPDPAI